MDVFLFFMFFMMLLLPGFITMVMTETICRRDINRFRFVIYGLLSSFFIFLVNILGLRFIKGIPTVADLVSTYFNCLSFSSKYGLLVVMEAVLLGAAIGLICRFCRRSNNRIVSHEQIDDD